MITSLTLYALLGGAVYMFLGLMVVGFISWWKKSMPADAAEIFFLASFWPIILVVCAVAEISAASAMVLHGVVGGVMRTLTNLEARGRGGKES